MASEDAHQRSIVIVGGGLSGSLLALRAIEDPNNRVTVIEKAAALGRGVAYGACDPGHMLNVPLFRMELGLAPTFESWLRENRPEEINTHDGGERDSFVTRRSFGDYVSSIAEAETVSGRLKRVRGDVVEIGRDDGPYVLMQDGRVIRGTHVVLATGNLPPKTPRFRDEGVLDSPVFIPDPWDLHRDRLPASTDPILLIGTGLTMVDVALRLTRNGHTGPIIALSRHGLLPGRHVHGGQWPNAFEAGPLPPRQAFRKLRREAAEAAQKGVPWQRVIDAIRPSLASVWMSWSQTDRQRFLRHCRTIWDVRRHRMANAVAVQIDALLGANLEIRAGRIEGLRRSPAGALVTVRPRGSRDLVELEVATIINCTGPRSSFDDLNAPAFMKLKERGLLTPDELGLGVKTVGCALVDKYSTPSDWLFAMGPLTRPEWWEITAVPEISAQSHFLADGLGRAGQRSLLRDFVDLGSGI
ncbi:FAD/NAD(P)-binding protein [Chenggangzhangella methanolivorans]|uniref:FAD/NAD(P)-binding protein n=1 Tax=Chenggangzhangella methanolivorans TaxID=1437009 RepID=A0A9E6UG33_9HYPH|nr:FAD/NAD(P)-binding protein [Chenggangzhangella methanolivorans]QZN98337.1 FAD/NAD(P)-binding protein [Chenggangzhangella methanolivorans]